MLCKVSSLKGLSVEARDGRVGSVTDVLFEDDTWHVRWLKVDLGSSLLGRRVLLPASHVASPKLGASSLSVDLTMKQVEESPESGSDLPVSRQMEHSLYEHYGWAPYWSTPGMPYVPATAYPVVPAAPSPATGGAPAMGALPRSSQPASPEAEHDAHRGDPHLRSAGEVTGYYIHGRDADIGHVEDLLVEGDDWTIRYLVVDTKNWWPGKMVLVPQDWVADFGASESMVFLKRTREEIKNAPEYDPNHPIDGSAEI